MRERGSTVRVERDGGRGRRGGDGEAVERRAGGVLGGREDRGARTGEAARGARRLGGLGRGRRVDEEPRRGVRVGRARHQRGARGPRRRKHRALVLDAPHTRCASCPTF